MTRRYVLTGAPGAGKTTIAAALRRRGHVVVAEAATDVIGQTPQLEADSAAFLDRIVAVQRERQLAATGALQVFDRSPVCTLALAAYLGVAPPRDLAREAERIARERTYERRVLFVRLMGFITLTAARRISLAESERFERIHAEVYRDLGYELVDVPPAPLEHRVARVAEVIAAA
ncbi:AAA family ATPase [Dactylosporangium salmoneum]|uniref:AAA family ATPase n=1 Tax=Dactylosporangium salmoneum TaxID=53361 RepID=A0ABN3GYR7_9ACTN